MLAISHLRPLLLALLAGALDWAQRSAPQRPTPNAGTLQNPPPRSVVVPARLLRQPASGRVSGHAGQPAAAALAKKWRLVWADEFDQPGRPDPRNWEFETGFVRNHEAQWYQPDNARCENGLLVLEARQEARPNPTYQAGSPDWRTRRPTVEYTSASLSTQGRHQWQYGRFEMRARLDTRAGLWPVFWTLGVAGQWPSNGEIDIMEYYQGQLMANVASGTATPFVARWHRATRPVANFAPGWDQQFHVWRMDWDAQAIRLYVDEVLLNETLLAQTVNQEGPIHNPMQQPHYVLLSLALGGDNGGNLTGTTFPGRCEIDYVRVYQAVK